MFLFFSTLSSFGVKYVFPMQKICYLSNLAVYTSGCLISDNQTYINCMENKSSKCLNKILKRYALCIRCFSEWPLCPFMPVPG